jgi:hypothetical protein
LAPVLGKVSVEAAGTAEDIVVDSTGVCLPASVRAAACNLDRVSVLEGPSETRKSLPIRVWEAFQSRSLGSVPLLCTVIVPRRSTKVKESWFSSQSYHAEVPTAIGSPSLSDWYNRPPLTSGIVRCTFQNPSISRTNLIALRNACFQDAVSSPHYAAQFSTG